MIKARASTIAWSYVTTASNKVTSNPFRFLMNAYHRQIFPLQPQVLHHRILSLAQNDPRSPSRVALGPIVQRNRMFPTCERVPVKGVFERSHLGVVEVGDRQTSRLMGMEVS